MSEHGHDHHHEHGHDHGDDGHHHPLPASEAELRTRALEALLVEKGLVSTDAIDARDRPVRQRRRAAERRAGGGPRVDRSRSTAARLLADGSAAIAEMGYGGEEGHTMMVVENTPDVHNVIVCTLCSCYPWPVLGLPPTWYKSPPYRARVVAEPRAVLAEFGLELPDETEVRVWDSTAEVRYIVLPMRPEGTEGMSADELAELVTRDSMIGTGLPKSPATA